MGRTDHAEWKRRALAAEALNEQTLKLVCVNYKKHDVAKDVRDALLQTMHLPEDFRNVCMHTYADNAKVTEFLTELCKNTYQASAQAKKSKLPSEVFVANNLLARQGALNLILSLLTRLRSEYNMPVQVVALSILAYRTGLPKVMWKALCHAHVIMSIEWTEKFIKDLHALPMAVVPERRARLALTCYDNCGYYRHLASQRVGDKSDYLNTVNWYHIPLRDQHGVLPAGVDSAWKAQRPIIEHRFSAHWRHHAVLLEDCVDFCRDHGSLLNYPSQDPHHDNHATRYIIHEPLVNMDTASYLDNGIMLNTIWQEIRIELPGCTLVFVVGDEQTYDRMVKLKCYCRGHYLWAIPVPGEFHFCGHVLHGSFRLWWTILIEPISVFLGRKSVVKDWTMTKFNLHDELMMVVVEGIDVYLQEIFGRDWAQNWRALLFRCTNNWTSTLLVMFMLTDGFPYMALRNMLRMAPTPERRVWLDRFYRYECARLRSVNKFLYSMLCVHASFFSEYMHPHVYAAWSHYYTASLRGMTGRNVTLDGLMEKVNKKGKQMMRGKLSEERILSVIPWLNVINPIETAYMADMGPNYHGDDQRYNYNGMPDFDADVRAIRGLLVAVHAVSHIQATDNSDRNVLLNRVGRAYRVPWNHVATFNDGMMEYVEQHCDRLRW